MSLVFPLSSKLNNLGLRGGCGAGRGPGRVPRPAQLSLLRRDPPGARQRAGHALRGKEIHRSTLGKVS